MKAQFPIFHSHLDLSKAWWAQVAQKGDWALDATCGNGRDTLTLSRLFSGVIGLDIQEEAILATKTILGKYGACAELYCQGHDTFPEKAYQVPIRLIVYNLGYLPGGDKSITTQVETTMLSVEKALELLLPGGLISLTCYPGHKEGEKESIALMERLQKLDPYIWSVSNHVWENRKKSPHIFNIQKTIY